MTFRPETTGRSNPIARDFDRLRNTLRDNASAVAALPTGVVGFASVTANQGPFTALTDMTGLSVTFDAIAGRTYRVTARVAFSSTVANDEVFGTIYAPLPIQLQAGRVQCSVANQGYHMDLVLVWTQSVTASQTRYVRAQRVAGSGDITMQASTFAPAFILVEDLG